MPTYRVKLTQTVEYAVTVDAESEEEAEEKAIENVDMWGDVYATQYTPPEPVVVEEI